MKQLKERDVDRLIKVLDHCDRIVDCQNRFGNSYEAFLDDALYRDAAQMNLFQIGEQFTQLSDECIELIGDIPAREIIGLRNRIAHGYDSLEDGIIWGIMNEDVQELSKRIKAFLIEHGEDEFL